MEFPSTYTLTSPADKEPDLVISPLRLMAPLKLAETIVPDAPPPILANPNSAEILALAVILPEIETFIFPYS